MASLDCLMFGVGGTLTYDGYTDSIPATASVRLLDGDGTVKMNSQACTISTVNATLVAAVSRGDWNIAASSNSNMVAGGKFWLRYPDEEMLVRRITGTTVFLRRPAAEDHSNAGPIEGVTITATINSQVANSKWWDGSAEWNIDGSVYDRTAVICSMYPMRSVLPSYQDVMDVFPMLERGRPDEVDIERLCIMGKDRVMTWAAHRAPDRRAETFVGSKVFRHAAALAVAMLYFMNQRGEENRTMYDRYKEQFEEQTDIMLGITPRDADQDGAVGLDERFTPGAIRLER